MAKQYEAAYLDARRAMRSLRLIERAHWEAAVQGFTSPLSSPAAVSFATLPAHWRLVDRLGASRLGQDRLAGGDFEDLGVMLRAGWNHSRHLVAGIQTTADLLPGAARSGNSGLRLIATPDDPENPPAMVETPPVWITSPAVPVEAGEVVCIDGWVQISAPITGSVDGLLIVDSLGGEDLAARIGQTEGWRRFTIYRAASQSGRVSVSFSLSGLGEVWIDDVTIQVLQPR